MMFVHKKAAALALMMALTACGGGGSAAPATDGAASSNQSLPPAPATAPQPAPGSASGTTAAPAPAPTVAPAPAAAPAPAPSPAPAPAAPTPAVIANAAADAMGVAVLTSGVRVAAWSDGANVYSQRFDAAGNLVGDQLQIGAQARFSGVAALASGGYVVEYQRPDAVFAQIVTSSGALAGAAIAVRTQAQVTADFPPDPNYPSEATSLAGGSGVVEFPDGSFAAEYLTYHLSHVPGDIPYMLYAQKYDPAGTPTGSPAALGSQGFASSFTTASVPAGGVLVADILACPCSGSGAPDTILYDQNLKSEHISYGGMPGDNGSPSAAALAGANFVMVWTHTAGPTNSAGQVQGQVFTPDATTVFGSRNVTQLLTFPNAAPGARVTALAGGGFLLAGHGSAQAFDANGQPVSPVMSTLDGTVAATPDGGFVVLAQVGSQLVEQQYSIAH